MLLLATAGLAAEPAAQPAVASAPGPGVAFEFNPLTALHAHLRARAETAAEATAGTEKATAALQPAIEAYRTFAAAAPAGPAGALHLQGADVLVASAASLEDLRVRLELAAGIPGSRLPVDALRTTLLPALEQGWPVYSASQAARDEAEVRERMAWWSAAVAPRLEPALAWLAKVVGVTPPAVPVPVRLVPEMPGKGAATFRTREGALIVAGTRRYQGSDFVEVVLHEMLHAWEAGAPESLGAALRARLEAAGADAEARRQVPHLLIFLLAAEATDRFLDPEHMPVGEKYGAYSRGLDRYRTAIEPLLHEHVEGRLDRGVFIDRLTAAFAPAAAGAVAPAAPGAD